MTTRAPNSLMKKPVTDWVAYTPVFTGFGTATNIECKSRRVGDSLEIQGRITDGTPTATQARISLGFNGTNGNVTSANDSRIPATGPSICGVASMGQNSDPIVLMERNTGYVTFGLQGNGTGGVTQLNGNIFVGTNMTFTFFATIPIQGW